ncbi:MAG: glycosyltransferase, partial [Bacteroidota bacterium]
MKNRHIIFTVINDLNYDQRMIRICKSLVEEGYTVTLVGRQLKRSTPLRDQPFRQIRLHCFFEKGKLFYLEYNWRLLFFLLRRSWDAVCAVDLDTILPAYYVAKWKNKKMIYDAHEYFTEVPEVISRPRVKSIWEWIGNHTVPHLQFCYTVGDALADILQKKYGTPFEVIRNVPFPSATAEQEKDKKIILYQGALNVGRGLE